MNQTGRDDAVEPGRDVSSMRVLTVHARRRAVELHHLQVDDLAGDVEERDASPRRRPRPVPSELPSFVTRSSSAPVFASRITTSVPNALVFVAAMYRPSRDQAGSR